MTLKRSTGGFLDIDRWCFNIEWLDRRLFRYHAGRVLISDCWPGSFWDGERGFLDIKLVGWGRFGYLWISNCPTGLFFFIVGGVFDIELLDRVLSDIERGLCGYKLPPREAFWISSSDVWISDGYSGVFGYRIKMFGYRMVASVLFGYRAVRFG